MLKIYTNQPISLLLIFLLISLTHNISHTMLRFPIARNLKPTISCNIQNLTSLPTRYMSSAIQQYAFCNRQSTLGKIAVASAILYGAYSFTSDTESQQCGYGKRKKDARSKEKTKLATLHATDKQSYATFIKAVIASGLDPHEFITKKGKSPLLQACDFDDPELFDLLIKHGGSSLINKSFFITTNYEVLASGPIECTIVTYAICRQKHDIVKILTTNPFVKIDVEKTDRLLSHISRMSSDYYYEIYYKKDKSSPYEAYRAAYKENEKKDSCKN